MQISQGKKFKITNLPGRDNNILMKKILSMGIRIGSVITIHQLSPFKGPVKIEHNGFNLGIRWTDLMLLKLETVE